MKVLIDDYKRRLDTVEKMLEAFHSSGSINDIKKKERLQTKASEYRTFIAELEREVNSHENSMKKMVELGLIKEVDKTVIEVIKRIPQQPQVQYDLTRQLQELRVAANKLGLYDAADYLRNVIKDKTDICLNKEEVETFMHDISNGNGVWSDTSYRILEFIGIDPTQGT